MKLEIGKFYHVRMPKERTLADFDYEYIIKVVGYEPCVDEYSVEYLKYVENNFFSDEFIGKIEQFYKYDEHIITEMSEKEVLMEII